VHVWVHAGGAPGAQPAPPAVPADPATPPYPYGPALSLRDIAEGKQDPSMAGMYAQQAMLFVLCAARQAAF
jgi:hypothetical protein